MLRTQSQAEYHPGEHRPFRPEPPALRPFHLADPPLCRPHRPPGADRRAEAWARRPAEGRRGGAAGDRRADFGGRAPRHGGRARHHRPAGGALARRPDRRHLQRADRRGRRAPACSSSSTRPAPTASCRCARSARTISSIDEARHAVTGQRTGETHRLGDSGRGQAGRGGAARRRAALRASVGGTGGAEEGSSGRNPQARPWQARAEQTGRAGPARGKPPAEDGTQAARHCDILVGRLNGNGFRPTSEGHGHDRDAACWRQEPGLNDLGLPKRAAVACDAARLCLPLPELRRRRAFLPLPQAGARMRALRRRPEPPARRRRPALFHHRHRRPCGRPPDGHRRAADQPAQPDVTGDLAAADAGADAAAPPAGQGRADRAAMGALHARLRQPAPIRTRCPKAISSATRPPTAYNLPDRPNTGRRGNRLP